MATNKLQWKRIAKGDKLPCQSFLRKKDGEILKLSTVAGVTVGQDAYYLPVDDVIEEIKNYPIEESENEKTKRLLHTIANKMGQHLRDIFTEEEYQCFDAWSNAWLEKQGEHANFRNNIQIGDKVTRNEDGVLVNLSQLNRVAKKDEKQGEQKSIKVPKFKVGDFIQFKGIGHTRYTVKEVCGLSHYINTCNKRMDMSYTDANFELVEQNPAEWSEEDENIYNAILDTIYNNLGLCSIHREWFKNIKERLKSLRPQSHWKPNKEQMNGLKEAIEFLGCTKTRRESLQSLYEQLKKLK